MTENEFERIEKMIARRIEIMEENVQHKFDLLVEVVVEGQKILAGRMDTVLQGEDTRLSPVEGRRSRVETKIDGLATAYSPHKADTEAHRGGYQVREE